MKYIKHCKSMKEAVDVTASFLRNGFNVKPNYRDVVIDVPVSRRIMTALESMGFEPMQIMNSHVRESAGTPTFEQECAKHRLHRKPCNARL